MSLHHRLRSIVVSPASPGASHLSVDKRPQSSLDKRSQWDSCPSQRLADEMLLGHSYMALNDNATVEENSNVAEEEEKGSGSDAYNDDGSPFNGRRYLVKRKPQYHSAPCSPP